MQLSAMTAACKCITFAIPMVVALRSLALASWGELDCADSWHLQHILTHYVTHALGTGAAISVC